MEDFAKLEAITQNWKRSSMGAGYQSLCSIWHYRHWYTIHYFRSLYLLVFVIPFHIIPLYVRALWVGFIQSGKSWLPYFESFYSFKWLQKYFDCSTRPNSSLCLRLISYHSESYHFELKETQLIQTGSLSTKFESLVGIYNLSF